MPRTAAIMAASALLLAALHPGAGGQMGRRMDVGSMGVGVTPGGDDAVAVLPAAAGWTTVASCDDLAARAAMARSRGGGMYFGRGVGNEGAGAAGDLATPALPSGSTAVDGGLTGTNVQVEGVDEPDVVDTEGHRMVTAVDGWLRLLDLSGDLRELDKVDLRGTVEGDAQLLLAGDGLTTIHTSWSIGTVLDDTGVTALTVVVTWDLSGDELREVGRTAFDGTLVAARGVGDIVHLVVVDPGLWLQRSGGSMGAGDPASLLPRQFRVGEHGIVSSTPLVECDEVLVVDDERAVGESLVTVITLDTDDASLTPVGTATVMTGASIVSATADRLVVASPTGWWAASEPAVVQGQADPPGDDVVVAPLPDPDIVTQLSLFALMDEGPRLLGGGEVPGLPIDQFAIDVQGDQVRVAATEPATWTPGGMEQPSQSAVTVLELAGDGLRTIGRVEGIAPTEDIQSVRFQDDVAWVVTFRRMDPLFAIDLTDPTEPEVRGELKIPGFSSYLQPLSDGMLLGVGQDATDEGMTTGLQVSLFDVSDLDNPRRVDRVGIGNATSLAEHDHHALLVDGSLIALPYERWDEDVELGAWIIHHEGDNLDAVTTLTSEVTLTQPVRRMVASDERLYLVSGAGIDVYDRDNLDHLSSLEF